MATEKQIAANRANAQRSTGPKSAAGKRKASRNAYRHGRSRPMPLDPLATARVEAIVRALVDADAGVAGQEAAREWAEAQLEVLRVRGVRAEMWDRPRFRLSPWTAPPRLDRPLRERGTQATPSCSPITPREGGKVQF